MYHPTPVARGTAHSRLGPHDRPTPTTAGIVSWQDRIDAAAEFEVEPADWPGPGEPMAVARRIATQFRSECGTLLIRRWRGQWLTWKPGHSWAEEEKAAVRADLYHGSTASNTGRKSGKTNSSSHPGHRAVGRSETSSRRSERSRTFRRRSTRPVWIDHAAGPRPAEIVALETVNQ
jgi:hypothetical protein